MPALAEERRTAPSFAAAPLPPASAAAEPSRRLLLLLVLAITLLGAVVRLAELGALGFYADEDTSALPVRALVEGHGATMPSGMEYRRALPLTWLTALSVRAVGEDAELGYRLPVAVLGILTIPVLFLAGRRLVGWRAALVAATLLAVSEWHVVFSRQARMYVPFMLAFLVAALLLWLWSREGEWRRLAPALAALAVAVSLHALAVLALLFALLPPFMERSAGEDGSTDARRGVRAWQALLTSGTCAVAAMLYDRFFVRAPFAALKAANTASPTADGAAPVTDASSIASILLGSPAATVCAVLGAALGIALAVRIDLGSARVTSPLVRVARGLCAAAAGLLAGAGQLYGAAVAAAVLVLLWPSVRSARGALAPAALLALLGAARLAGAAIATGPWEAVRGAMTFPFPYAAMLAEQGLGSALLLAALCAVLLLRRAAADDGVRASILAVLLPVATLGVVSAWGGARYLFPVLPFFLLAAAAMLDLVLRAGFRRLRRGDSIALGAALLLVLVGALGGGGVATAWRVVTLRHGEPVREVVHMYGFRPDHRGVGRWLASAREAGDVVVAEDPIEMAWYAGAPVDFWLRAPSDARAFLFRDAEGTWRDLYVGSRPASPALLDSLVATANGRVWVVTSGETAERRDYYLDEGQRAWLAALERSRPAAFTGEDGATRVYCASCVSGTPE